MYCPATASGNEKCPVASVLVNAQCEPSWNWMTTPAPSTGAPVSALVMVPSSPMSAAYAPVTGTSTPSRAMSAAIARVPNDRGVEPDFIPPHFRHVVADGRFRDG